VRWLPERICTPLMPSTMPEDAVKHFASWCRHKTAELATACKTLPTLSYYFDIQVSRFRWPGGEVAGTEEAKFGLDSPNRREEA
jgi:hypothetical protein